MENIFTNTALNTPCTGTRTFDTEKVRELSLRLGEVSPATVLSAFAARLISFDSLFGSYKHLMDTTQKLTENDPDWGLCLYTIDQMSHYTYYLTDHFTLTEMIRIYGGEEREDNYDDTVDEIKYIIEEVFDLGQIGDMKELICAVLCLLCRDDEEIYNYTYNTLIPVCEEGTPFGIADRQKNTLYTALELIRAIRTESEYISGYDAEDAAVILDALRAYDLDCMLDGYDDEPDDEPDEEYDEFDRLVDELDWGDFFRGEEG